MDVCPVEALDMSRPEPAGDRRQGRLTRWLMEHPLQVGECIGCHLCARECPVSVIIDWNRRPATQMLAPRQGPIRLPAPDSRLDPAFGGHARVAEAEHPSLSRGRARSADAHR